MNPLKLAIFDLDDTLCNTSEIIQLAQSDPSKIQLFPGVTDLLKQIRGRGIHTAIVSTGDSLTQEKKIEILGLRQLVDGIFICATPEEKHGCFVRCLRDFGAMPEQTAVIGDRIDREIAMGKSLKCITVRVLSGRHNIRTPASEHEVADFTVNDIAALRSWFEVQPI